MRFVTKPIAALLLLLAAVSASPAELAAQAETVRLSGESVGVYNLVGVVRVHAGTASDVVVSVRLQGRDADQLEIVSGRVDSRRKSWGDIEALRVVYPGSKVSYSGAGRRADVRVETDGTIRIGGRGQIGGRRVVIANDGDGLRASADVDIEMPRDKRVLIVLASGTIEVTNVLGELSLNTATATMRAAGTSGKLSLATRSGNVIVERARGILDIDSGSGPVTVRSAWATEAHVDTGSGDVILDDVEAPRIGVHTGSGDIEMTKASADSIIVATGSGDVTIAVQEGYAGEIRLKMGSGRLDNQLPLAVMRRSRSRRNRREVRGTVGEGGSARMKIETGSGDIRLRQGGD